MHFSVSEAAKLFVYLLSLVRHWHARYRRSNLEDIVCGDATDIQMLQVLSAPAHVGWIAHEFTLRVGEHGHDVTRWCNGYNLVGHDQRHPQVAFRIEPAAIRGA